MLISSVWKLINMTLLHKCKIQATFYIKYIYVLLYIDLNNQPVAHTKYDTEIKQQMLTKKKKLGKPLQIDGVLSVKPGRKKPLREEVHQQHRSRARSSVCRLGTTLCTRDTVAQFEDEASLQTSSCSRTKTSHSAKTIQPGCSRQCN